MDVSRTGGCGRRKHLNERLDASLRNIQPEPTQRDAPCEFTAEELNDPKTRALLRSLPPPDPTAPAPVIASRDLEPDEVYLDLIKVVAMRELAEGLEEHHVSLLARRAGPGPRSPLCSMSALRRPTSTPRSCEAATPPESPGGSTELAGPTTSMSSHLGPGEAGSAIQMAEPAARTWPSSRESRTSAKCLRPSTPVTRLVST